MNKEKLKELKHRIRELHNIPFDNVMTIRTFYDLCNIVEDLIDEVIK